MIWVLRQGPRRLVALVMATLEAPAQIAIAGSILIGGSPLPGASWPWHLALAALLIGQASISSEASRRRRDALAYLTLAAILVVGAGSLAWPASPPTWPRYLAMATTQAMLLHWMATTDTDANYGR